MPQTYIPKKEHPWRRYKDRVASPALEVQESKIRPFLQEIVENYDTYDISTSDSFANGRIKYMSDQRVALWLIDMLQRNFIGYKFVEENE